ncbi:MAG: sulfite exporter TauE/SafE family protein [Campylobacterota bacterium]|nr:sulfite exporter TauE/SafE family protein [Campylobacterota bacterium]
MIEFSLLGMMVGLLSGFFGIGGGTLSIPGMLYLGFNMKAAVGISVIQMVFSSIYGSYLNKRNGTLDIALVTTIGIGGLIGAQIGGYFLEYWSDKFLEMLFFILVIFSMIRIFISPKEHKERIKHHPLILVAIGMVLGALSVSLGVGGSILLVPILIGFLHVDIKSAISAGLFFVVFSSISGLVSLSMSMDLDYISGIILGVTSLIGVRIGVHFKDKVDNKTQKTLLLIMYIVLALYLVIRMING